MLFFVAWTDDNSDYIWEISDNDNSLTVPLIILILRDDLGDVSDFDDILRHA